MQANVRRGADGAVGAVDVNLPAKKGNDATAGRRHISDFASRRDVFGLARLEAFLPRRPLICSI
jgi:hypothetical protein